MIQLFNRLPIFISHKRDNGQASVEARMINDTLDREKKFKVFFDGNEPYLGEFPVKLEEEIRQCKVFILVLRKNQPLDYLKDKNNWVHKEIKTALDVRMYIDKGIKIIPISMDKNIKFPPKDELGEIGQITDFDIIYYDTNDIYASKKLYNAIGYPGSSYYVNKRSIGALLILIILFIFCYMLIAKKINLYDKTIDLYKRDLKTFKEFYNPNIEVEISHEYYTLITKIDTVIMDIIEYYNNIIEFDNYVDKRGFEKDYNILVKIYQKRFNDIEKFSHSISATYLKIYTIFCECELKKITDKTTINEHILETLTITNTQLDNYKKFLTHTNKIIEKNKNNPEQSFKTLDKYMQSKEFNEYLNATRSTTHAMFVLLIDLKTSILKNT